VPRRAEPKRVLATFCSGNFVAGMTARTSLKLYFPRPYVPMLREENIVKLIPPSGVVLSLSFDLRHVTSVYTRSILHTFKCCRTWLRCIMNTMSKLLIGFAQDSLDALTNVQWSVSTLTISQCWYIVGTTNNFSFWFPPQSALDNKL